MAAGRRAVSGSSPAGTGHAERSASPSPPAARTAAGPTRSGTEAARGAGQLVDGPLAAAASAVISQPAAGRRQRADRTRVRPRAAQASAARGAVVRPPVASPSRAVRTSSGRWADGRAGRRHATSRSYRERLERRSLRRHVVGRRAAPHPAAEPRQEVLAAPGEVRPPGREPGRRALPAATRRAVSGHGNGGSTPRATSTAPQTCWCPAARGAAGRRSTSAGRRAPSIAQRSMSTAPCRVALPPAPSRCRRRRGPRWWTGRAARGRERSRRRRRRSPRSRSAPPPCRPPAARARRRRSGDAARRCHRRRSRSGPAASRARRAPGRRPRARARGRGWRGSRSGTPSATVAPALSAVRPTAVRPTGDACRPAGGRRGPR